MTDTGDKPVRFHPYPPLDVPLGQVLVTKDAVEALALGGTSLDDVLAQHAEGYGGDFDYEERFENYDTAAAGGDNSSLYTVAEGVTLLVHTPWHRQTTVVSLYTEAE